MIIEGNYSEFFGCDGNSQKSQRNIVAKAKIGVQVQKKWNVGLMEFAYEWAEDLILKEKTWLRLA
jgi:hypothetical protein